MDDIEHYFYPQQSENNNNNNNNNDKKTYKKITTSWDPYDIPSLKKAINNRPTREEMEILNIKNNNNRNNNNNNNNNLNQQEFFFAEVGSGWS
jgi:hypothetical protein